MAGRIGSLGRIKLGISGDHMVHMFGLGAPGRLHASLLPQSFRHGAMLLSREMFWYEVDTLDECDRRATKKYRKSLGNNGGA